MIVVELLDGLGGEVVEVLVGAFGIEPGDPFGGRQFDLVDVAPWALPANEFVLERPDGGLGQRVVECVAHRANRGVHAFVEEALGEGHRGVLGRFKGSMQHRLVSVRIAAVGRPRQAYAIEVPFGAWS